jgi:hypothetical protein
MTEHKNMSSELTTECRRSTYTHKSTQKVMVAAAAVVMVYCKIPLIQTRLQYTPDVYRTSPKLITKIYMLD